jgi:predicted O-methyltransferase YrrM
MRENSRAIAHEMLSACDFTQFDHIVDVGGGNGTSIAGLLAACRQATGTLLDLAHVVAGAAEVLEQAGVRQRCKVLAGSFFDGVPAGGDVYVLKSILHDWDDPEAHTILRNCREAMHRCASLLVVERMLAPPNQGAEGKMSDLNMLVNAGGRERTCAEFTALLASAGFDLRAVTRLPSSRFLIEATPSASL